LLEEVTDRFGKLPAQGQALFDTHRLRIQAKPYGIVKIDAGPKLMNIGFKPNPPIDPMRILELVQKNRAIKLSGNDRLRIDREIPEARDRAQYVRDVLRALGAPVAGGAAQSAPVDGKALLPGATGHTAAAAPSRINGPGQQPVQTPLRRPLYPAPGTPKRR
jgi:hypothetical protein